jgi:hypothetical protein
MSVVGVLTFFSLETMTIFQNFTTMIDKIESIVVGVALAGRMVSILHTIRHWNQLLKEPKFRAESWGFESPTPRLSKFCDTR